MDKILDNIKKLSNKVKAKLNSLPPDVRKKNPKNNLLSKHLDELGKYYDEVQDTLKKKIKTLDTPIDPVTGLPIPNPNDPNNYPIDPATNKPIGPNGPFDPNDPNDPNRPPDFINPNDDYPNAEEEADRAFQSKINNLKLLKDPDFVKDKNNVKIYAKNLMDDIDNV